MSSVRAQLRIVFAFVILVSTLATAIAIWRLHLASQETEALTRRPLAKERLTSQWLLNTSVSAKRTAAVARTSDPELARAFAAEGTESSRRTTILQNKVGELLDTPEEKALFEAIAEARALHLQPRPDHAAEGRGPGHRGDHAVRARVRAG